MQARTRKFYMVPLPSTSSIKVQIYIYGSLPNEKGCRVKKNNFMDILHLMLFVFSQRNKLVKVSSQNLIMFTFKYTNTNTSIWLHKKFI